MNFPHKLKNWVAGALIIAGIAAPVAMFVGEAVGTDPKLSFKGVSLQTYADGSVQAIFQVGVTNLDNCTGVSFFLEYQDKYLTPSNMADNKALASGSGIHAEDGFFGVDPDLYAGANPFAKKVAWYLGDFSMWDASNHVIAMNLTLDNKDLSEVKGKLDTIQVGEEDEPRYVFHSGTLGDPQNEEVVLGYLSFQVEPEYLPLIAERFDIINDSTSAQVNGDYLIQVKAQNSKTMPEPWQISFFEVFDPMYPMQTVAKNYSKSRPGSANVYYTFDFPQEVVDIQATEQEVTVDAYQAYTDGTLQDVAATLRKFSPMATLTYTDGSRGHQVIPWGAADTDELQHDFRVYQYDPTVVYYVDTGKYAGAEVTTSTYTATHGDYIVQQYCYYTKQNDDGTTTQVRSPRPITVHLKVTPIHLVDVTADDLHKTYALDGELVTNVTTVSDLHLPSQARLSTDIPVDGASLMMDIPGWTSKSTYSVWPTGKDLDKLVEDSATSTDHHWPTNQDDLLDPAVVTKRVGTYSFPMASSMGGTETTFTASDIQEVYPWLTVPADREYPLTATRTIVGEGQVRPVTDYTVTWVSTNEDGHGDPVLTLEVNHADSSPLEAGSKFRVLLPDGSQMGIGSENAADAAWDDWFGNLDNSKTWDFSYTTKLQTEGAASGAFYLVTDPGSLEATDEYAAQRMALRRHINLGGNFFVAVNEKPDDTEYAWTDYIPVYVPPRANQHTEDKVYNFIGDNAGLYQYPGTIDTTVTVPQGEYTVVNNSGKTVYVDNASNAETTNSVDDTGAANKAKTEPFGAATTYDGVTGAEPGRLYTFRVEEDNWGPTEENAQGKTVYKYGPSPFADDAVYNAFGKVVNPDEHTATIRTPSESQPDQLEAITLTYEGTGNVVSDPASGNVTLATYDAQKEGYTVRQDYTFTITNVGTTTIYDLGIDTWTDNADSVYDGGGGHFEMLRKPASYLMPGDSTTFTLTYVYDLKATAEGKGLDYTDTLFITSSNHRKTGTGAVQGTDYLLDFDATFMVSKDDLYRVTVIYEPEGMGTANTILGPRTVDGTEVMNLTTGSSTYPEDQTVYFVVSPEDEYTIKSITVTSDNGGTIQHDQYTGSATLADGRTVYYFTMPQDDVTVHVVFEEPISSKLRLSDLRVYADDEKERIDKEADIGPDYRKDYLQRIFQKDFTDAEQNAADQAEAVDHIPREQYLMTVGRAVKEGFESTKDQYLVVIPNDAEFAQVTAVLREVLLPKEHPEGIEVLVEMTLYESDGRTYSTILSSQHGATNAPTTHYSEVFASPEAGKSKYVEITITYVDPIGASTTASRRYYVEILREKAQLDAILNYGNSPYGMIMNSDMPDGDKSTAKTMFVNNGYTFQGILPASYIPKAVIEGGLTNVRYNTEAWVKVKDSRYEPESYTALSDYDAKQNMDLNDYALFVYGSGAALTDGALVAPAFEEPGIAQKDGVYQIWDSSGRLVPIENVRRYVEVQVLDVDAATQTARFDLPQDQEAERTVRIPLDGNAGVHKISAGWTQAPVQERNADGTLMFDALGEPVYKQKQGANGQPETDSDGNPVYETETVYIRPGVYKLVYLYADFDGQLPTTPTRIDRLPSRPFIVLAKNGDVNADGQVVFGNAATGVANDELLLKGRVEAPLGYQAENYPDYYLFRNRVCDVNNDRNINNIDANELRNREPLLAFYLAEGYGLNG